MVHVKELLVLTIYVFYMWPMKFKIYGDVLWYFIYAGIPVLCLLWNYKILVKWLCGIKNVIIKFLFIYIMALLWGGVSVSINNGDFTYYGFLLRIIQNIVIYIFLLLVQYHAFGKISIESFFKYYIVSICINVFSTIIFLINNDLKELWIQLLVQTDAKLDMADAVNQQTRFSLQGFSAFGQTALCALGALTSLYLMHKSKSVVNVWMFTFVVCLMGCLFYGRIGVILSILFYIIYELTDIKIVNLKRILVLGLIVTMLVIVTFYLAEYDWRIKAWLDWVSEPVESFLFGLQYGQISFGNSANKLTEDMYFMPEDDTIIFGDARYQNSDGSYYMHTDAGVLRHILYYGILGELLGYSLIILVVIELMKIFKKQGDKLLLIMMFLFTMLFMVLEIKGVIYHTLFGWLMVLLLIVSNKKNRLSGFS